MSTQISNLVQETSVSTGTGNLTLAVTNGYQTFANAFGTGATLNVFYYFIADTANNAWEVGTGHMSASTTMVRDTVIASTNANAAVNFLGGTLNVVNDLPAPNMISTADLGANVLTWLETPSGANFAACLTSAVPVTAGGTGVNTLASGGVVIGAGSSAVTVASPSIVNGILVSNGTTFAQKNRQPVKIAAGNLSSTSVTINTAPASIGFYSSFFVVVQEAQSATATVGLNIILTNPNGSNASYTQIKNATPTSVANSTTGIWTLTTATAAQTSNAAIMIYNPGAGDQSGSDIGSINYGGMINPAVTASSGWISSTNQISVNGVLVGGGSALGNTPLSSIQIMLNGTATFSGGTYAVYGIL